MAKKKGPQATRALLKMVELDICALKRAYNHKGKVGKTAKGNGREP